MARLFHMHQEIQQDKNDTVLQALLRHGVDVPHSCQNGNCLSCVVRSEQGPPPRHAQQKLPPTLVARRYFLSCQCKAVSLREKELHVSVGDSLAFHTPATLIKKQFLALNVAQLVFHTEEPLDYFPGQFVHLQRDDGVRRSYSIASGPNNPHHFELHIARVQNGVMSNYLANDLSIGARISTGPPCGNCFYLSGHAEQPMLLIGTGTGLAPLLGILRAAIAQDHQGPIHLYHGCYTAQELYLESELLSVASKHKNVHYYPCVKRDEIGTSVDKRIQIGTPAATALCNHTNLRGWRVFLCGQPAMVTATRKRCYLAGAAIHEIFADAFERHRPRSDSNNSHGSDRRKSPPNQ